MVQTRQRSSRSSLGLRFATAAVAVPLLFGIVLAGGPLYGLLLVAGSLLGAWEVRGMLRAGGYRPFDGVLLLLAVLLPLDAWFLVGRDAGLPLFGAEGTLLVGVALLCSLLLLLRRRTAQGAIPEGAMVDWALSVALALYVGGLLQFYAPLRDRPDGAYWVITAVGLTMICDTAAFFVGKRFGRAKLDPRVSEGKTVEGAVGAVVITTLWGAGWALVSDHPILPLAGLGLVIALAAIFGDLAESLLKRQTGVKDAGRLMPGHGGILDRMDSLLFCAPVAVLYLALLGLIGVAA